MKDYDNNTELCRGEQSEKVNKSEHRQVNTEQRENGEVSILYGNIVIMGNQRGRQLRINTWRTKHDSLT